MDPILNNPRKDNIENDDEEYGCYFLQPASSPYNITEKVQQANLDLSNNISTIIRTPKVKFKEELTSYEPNLTDDDVNSIESDSIETSLLNTNETNCDILEQDKACNVINLNIFNINEDDEDDEEEEEEEDRVVVEELIESDNDDDDIAVISDNCVKYDENNDYDENIEISSPTIKLSPKSNKKTNKNSVTFRKEPKIHQFSCNTIDCKSHCIERLDFNLSMSIKKLQIHEKPPNCPLLRLQTRQCCDEIKRKNPRPNLPCYNGYRSEYGLSSTALEKREKHQKIIELKQQKRKQLLEEYKNRKNQQNEAVFCQWLKNVAKRKLQQQQQNEIKLGNSSKKQLLSPNVINFPTKVNENLKSRPKTANELVTKRNVKKLRSRPHTSPACVFIKISPKLLKKGIQIGDLLISNRDIETKELNIMTISS